ncbi:lysine-specific demethylase JMJ17 [Andrographis paniculata]|uniref:lysine-specific demethylase JMJ17 n=1 Tax=Andrographis paniculata TaxID=175694 RepID=UPI0021E6DEE1|nr:lysine-specific demethylase JMJ17 [Andrographis paniculata]
MGRGRTRKVEKVVSGGSGGGGELSGCGSLNVPSGPVFYPSEEEFKDPLEYIYKIRPEAEPYGICKIVPPKSWDPPFALDMEKFTFPTKSQAIHQLQARSAPCDSKTFRLEYGRFLEEHCGKKAKKRIVFEGDELDLCKLFNGVKRFGGYDRVAKGKKWGEVYRFIRPGQKISECSKHVLSLLYLEHLLDYEEYYCQLNKEKRKGCKRGTSGWKRCEPVVEATSVKRRRSNKEGERVDVIKAEEAELDQICEQCRSGLHGDVMLLCDRCNKGWHIYCLSPPLKRIPPGNWYCQECLNSEKDCFGFVPGKQFSLEAFKRVADRVKKKWFGSTDTSWAQLEKKFWEIVEGSVGEVEVMYGNDLDTSIYGSGFPRQADTKPQSVDGDVWDEHCTSPWNLNNLPRLQDSILRTVHQNIAGVMVPWLYIGMLFSSFCWHFEDHCFYSMNYHHWGEPKCWYSVPGKDIHAFEKVMRSTLPDLFEAQPDLLFQLVTMLNPSVLQDKGVPVYSIIQEPGNFVITFPRSYHGGFNFGLNCAEAVNFAPADWLPHGGFGAELYRYYHRVPVLSHEELLCVVAKSDLESRASTYLKKELLRMYSNEKTWRERLWKNGIIKSSPMTPRVKPEYVGTEEDPMCVICQQLLYLSAVSCNCRPSAYVCLEHWEHLCECKPNKRRLLYRHTLAELSGLLFSVGKSDSIEVAGDSQKDMCTAKVVALTKKVKGGHVTHAKLAEEWVLKSCKILEHPYSKGAYDSAIKEAEQFIWAGSEMDLVREINNNLIQAHKWAEDVIECICKVKIWSSHRNCDKVQMDHVNEILRHPAPCNEPSHLQLKEYQEEANTLIQDINSVLTSCSEYSISDMEFLYKRAVNSPIHVKECDILNLKLSAMKAWLDTVTICLSQESTSPVGVDVLYKLETEMLELKLQLPEADMLSGLVGQVKLCLSQCNEMLKGKICLKDVKLFLSQWENLNVKIPELELLKKFYNDAISWISRVDLVLTNAHERADQDNVVAELTTLQRDGGLLQIQVDELPLVEVELKKAQCRVEALKVLNSLMSMDFINELISEAAMLQIDKEKLFTDISERHSVAMGWEDKAKHVLASRAPLSDFEDMLRTFDHIGMIPPSLLDVKNAVSTAKAWLVKAKPFLFQDTSDVPPPDFFLQVDTLKDLVLESENLKVYMKECSQLEEVLKKAIGWEHNASSILQNAEHLYNIDVVEGISDCFIFKIEQKVLSMDSALRDGISLGLKFNLIPKLEDACSITRWCIKALSFPINIPTQKEVEMMLEASANFPVMYKSCPLVTALSECLSWLMKSLDILDSDSHEQVEVSFVEELLVQSKKICISFPSVICRLGDAIQNHKLWLEQVHHFSRLSLEERSWNMLTQLKECGSSKAFSCVELEMICLEVGKVIKWKQQCADIIKPPSAEENALHSALITLKDNVEKSVAIYGNMEHGKSRHLCLFCSISIEGRETLTCSICKDSFHLQCTEISWEDSVAFVCPLCNFFNNFRLPHKGSNSLRAGKKHLDLDKLSARLSDASDLYIRTEEQGILHQIVEKAYACSVSLSEVVNFALAYVGKDLDVVNRKLCLALKAINISGICDAEGCQKFDLALDRHSWKARADKILGSPGKPTLRRVRHHLKEGLALNIPPEDYFRQKLTALRDMGLRWAYTAKKVSVDGGVLGLDRVFELISEGECLPVDCVEELQLLRDRSMLYCICRRPYDERAMIACDKCDEWYHFDCVKITSAPKTYICIACSPHSTEDMRASAPTTQDRFTGGKFEEPQTPSRRSELKMSSQKPKCISKKIIKPMGISNDFPKKLSSNDKLLWRNRKRFRRVARKRSDLQSLSPLLYVQNKGLM